MKFRKRLEFVELPEKSGSDYLNIRSAVRIDVRPGETLNVDTGLEYMVAKNEPTTWKLIGSNVVSTELTSGGYKKLYVRIRNGGYRNLMIYRGHVIASAVSTRKPKPAKKVRAARKPVKKAIFISKVEVENAE